jgi:hypothetical protein
VAPEPANRTGALIGYAQVSTSGQLLDGRQLRTPRSRLSQQGPPPRPGRRASGTASGYGVYGVWYAIGVTETWCR